MPRDNKQSRQTVLKCKRDSHGNLTFRPDTLIKQPAPLLCVLAHEAGTHVPFAKLVPGTLRNTSVLWSSVQTHIESGTP